MWGEDGESWKKRGVSIPEPGYVGAFSDTE